MNTIHADAVAVDGVDLGDSAAAEQADVVPTTRTVKQRVLIVARWALIAIVIAAVTWQIARQWDDVSVALRQVNVLSVVASFGAVVIGIVAGALSWQALLDDMGPKVGAAKGGQVVLVGQLGKYVPGSVWAYLLQMELGRRYGVARARVFAASLFAAGIGVVASLVLGVAAIPVVMDGHDDLLWLFALLPIGLVCLHPRVMTYLASLVFRVLRRPPLDHRLAGSVVARAFGWAVISYACFGFHLWILANSLVDPGFNVLLLCIGTIAIGLTAGLFAIFLPSGVGVREAIIVGALGTVMTAGAATGLAVASRMIFTVGDLLVAGGAALLAVFVQRRSLEHTAVDEQDHPELLHDPDAPVLDQTAR